MLGIYEIEVKKLSETAQIPTEEAQKLLDMICMQTLKTSY